MDTTTEARTEKRRLKREITKAVRLWANRLQLQEWRIRVEFTTFGSEDGYGSCKCLSSYRTALLEFDLDRMPPHEDVDQLVVHEFMHILTMPLHEYAALGLTPVEIERLDHAAERIVHDISVRIVKLVAGKDFPALLFKERAEDAQED